MSYPQHSQQGPQGYYPPPAPQAPAPRPWYRRKRVLIPAGFVGLLIVVGVANGGGDNGATAPAVRATAAPTTPVATLVPAAPVAPAAPVVPAAPAPVAAPAGPLTTFGNGTYEVGTDVAPGKYRSAGVADSAVPLCYWDLTDASGSIKDQGVANEGPSRATLRAGLTFKSQGCQDWVQQS